MTYLLALSSFLSRILGIVRDNRFAEAFGAGDLSDVYFAAFQIPDLLYSVVIYGALSASFVPIFIGFMKRDEKEAMWRFTGTVMLLLSVCIAVVSLVILFTAPWIVKVLYPGFSADQHITTVQLLRIMLLSPLFFGISAVFSSIQTAFRHFIFYALAPIVYNAAIIFGIVFLAPDYGIHGVAYGVVAGAFLHALVQMPIAVKLGFRPTLLCSWKSSAIRQLLTLGLPRMLSILVMQINLFIEAIIASIGMVGGLTVLRYAQNLASFPLGIVGLSVAISSFSTLSALALANDSKKSFMKHLGEQVANILFFILPASVGLILLGHPIVRLLLQGGNFDAGSTTSTAVTLSLLSIGLFATSLIPLMQRAFYALENTRTPLLLSVLSVATNGVLSFVLAQRYGVYGIAIANTFAVILHIILLSVFLRRDAIFNIRDDVTSRENTILVRNSIVKMIFLSAVMAGVILGIQNFIPVTQEYSSVLISTCSLVVAGALVYLFGAYLLKLPELRRNVLFQKLARLRNADI